MDRGSHPYRVCWRSDAPSLAGVDPLASGQRVARAFVLGWAFLRVAACALRGMDPDGFFALVILVAGFASLTRSFT